MLQETVEVILDVTYKHQLKKKMWFSRGKSLSFSSVIVRIYM